MYKVAFSIPTENLKAMVDKGESFTPVNVLPRIIHDLKHIEGSLNIPVGKIMTSPDMPKDKKIVLIDHKGKTTLMAGRFLTSKGYKDLVRLDGGFNAWAKTRYPVAYSR